MPSTTVAYKFNGKHYIGIVENNIIDYFERLEAANSEGFDDNTFYIMMISDDEYPDIVELDKLFVDFESLDEDEFVATANNILNTFKAYVTFH